MNVPAPSNEEAPLLLGSACLCSFVVSGLTTLLVCALAPVRSVSLPQDLQGSGKTRGRPPLLSAIGLDTGRESEERRND